MIDRPDLCDDVLFEYENDNNNKSIDNNSKISTKLNGNHDNKRNRKNLKLLCTRIRPSVLGLVIPRAANHQAWWQRGNWAASEAKTWPVLTWPLPLLAWMCLTTSSSAPSLPEWVGGLIAGHTCQNSCDWRIHTNIHRHAHTDSHFALTALWQIPKAMNHMTAEQKEFR